MIGPVRRRKAFRFGIVLLALSALVSVVAPAFHQPQQLSELIVVATGPCLPKLLVGRVTLFAGSTPTRQTLNSGLFNERLDSGRSERGGFAEAEINDFPSSGRITRDERWGRNSAV